MLIVCKRQPVCCKLQSSMCLPSGPQCAGRCVHCHAMPCAHLLEAVEDAVDGAVRQAAHLQTCTQAHAAGACFTRWLASRRGGTSSMARRGMPVLARRPGPARLPHPSPLLAGTRPPMQTSAPATAVSHLVLIEHCVRLAGSRLAVRKNRPVVAVQHLGNEVRPNGCGGKQHQGEWEGAVLMPQASRVW